MRFWKPNFYNKYIKYESDCTSQPLLVFEYIQGKCQIYHHDSYFTLWLLISVSILKQLTKSYRHNHPEGVCYEVSQMTQIFKIYTPSFILLLTLFQIKRVNVKTSWRKINWSALPIRLDSVETDVYKIRLFLFEIVLLLHETKRAEPNYKHRGSKKKIVTFTTTIHPEVCCRSSDISALVDTLPKVSFMSISDGFVFTSTGLWEKINGSCVGELTLLWQMNSAF